MYHNRANGLCSAVVNVRSAVAYVHPAVVNVRSALRNITQFPVLSKFISPFLIHFHLIPKYVDGPDFGGVFRMNPKEVYLSDAEYQEMAGKLVAAMQ